jgi:hypothetical protein
MGKQNNKEKRNKYTIFGLLILILLLAGALVYLLFGKGADGILPDGIKVHLTPDDNAEHGKITGKDKDAIVDALNKKVQEGMINISINSNPIFPDGKSKGTLMISNSETNNYPQQVEIYTDGDNKLIYAGSVEVGGKIETSKLAVALPKGEYPCLAYFKAVDPKTSNLIGYAIAEIIVTVQK